jgi:fumarylpyruvate hydrolase
VTAFVFPPAPQSYLEVEGGAARFPVRRVWCVGRNYLAHVREMGNDEREPPFFFSKQPDMVVPGGGTIRYPALTKDFQHEVELVVALKSGGRGVAVSQAMDCVFGYAVGIDLTRRDQQSAAKAKGKPWEIAKSFEQSAPCGALMPAGQAGDIAQAVITLTVNGAPRQSSSLAHMIWSVAEIVAHLSEQVDIAGGDIIFTGTPEGVAPVVAGDRLEAVIAGLAPLSVTIA